MAEGFHPLSHANKEVVLAADFNRYGTRLVTGSADHRLRIFDLKDGEWVLLEEWRGHNAEVTDVCSPFFAPITAHIYKVIPGKMASASSSACVRKYIRRYAIESLA
jgi:WD40 repeat protein